MPTPTPTITVRATTAVDRKPSLMFLGSTIVDLVLCILLCLLAELAQFVMLCAGCWFTIGEMEFMRQ